MTYQFFMVIVNVENHFGYWFGMYFLGSCFLNIIIVYFGPRMFELKQLEFWKNTFIAMWYCIFNVVCDESYCILLVPSFRFCSHIRGYNVLV
jgi:hypothetical protein